MEFRKSHLDAFVKKYGIKLGFMSVFSKAAAYALQDQPVINAVIDGQVNLIDSHSPSNCLIQSFPPIGNRLQRLCRHLSSCRYTERLSGTSYSKR